MLDPKAPHFTDPGGEALFADDGERGPTLNKVVEFLSAFQQEITATEQLLKPLDEAGILTVQRLELADFEGKTATIEGVRAIDREKLFALDDAVLAGWVRDGMTSWPQRKNVSIEHAVEHDRRINRADRSDHGEVTLEKSLVFLEVASDDAQEVVA